MIFSTTGNVDLALQSFKCPLKPIPPRKLFENKSTMSLNSIKNPERPVPIVRRTSHSIVIVVGNSCGIGTPTNVNAPRLMRMRVEDGVEALYEYTFLIKKDSEQDHLPGHFLLQTRFCIEVVEDEESHHRLECLCEGFDRSFRIKSLVLYSK
jgi:hypothetical protein